MVTYSTVNAQSVEREYIEVEGIDHELLCVRARTPYCPSAEVRLVCAHATLSHEPDFSYPHKLHTAQEVNVHLRSTKDWTHRVLSIEATILQKTREGRPQTGLIIDHPVYSGFIVAPNDDELPDYWVLVRPFRARKVSDRFEVPIPQLPRPFAFALESEARPPDELTEVQSTFTAKTIDYLGRPLTQRLGYIASPPHGQPLPITPKVALDSHDNLWVHGQRTPQEGRGILVHPSLSARWPHSGENYRFTDGESSSLDYYSFVRGSFRGLRTGVSRFIPDDKSVLGGLYMSDSIQILMPRK